MSEIPVNLLFKSGDNEWNTSKPSIWKGEIMSEKPVNLLFERGDNEWNTTKSSI